MSYSPPIAIVLTVLFALTGIGYAAFAFRPTSNGIARVGDVLHVLMSVTMLAMPWSWGTRIAPPALQIIVFGLGTLFYVALAFGGARTAHAHHGPGGSGRLILWYHVVMMAAMIAMGVMMLPMADCAAMDMPGMHMHGGSSSGMSLGPEWTVVGWVLVAVFAAATVWFAVRLTASTRARLHPLARIDDTLLLLMSAGMALAFLP